uniref:Non-structural polyprotein 1AB n=1 Tax=Rousettus bat astrovirus TaxID=3141900 RepID=A0AAU7E2G9_9VIRU
MIDITKTDKNKESTPAWPKCEYWKTEEEFLADVGFGDYVQQFDEIKNGYRPQVLWILFLKKEILKKKKVAERDIRQIVCSDPLFARIGLVFEQHQNSLMKDRTSRTFAQCGWTPFYGGFEKRVRRLVSKGNHTFVEFDWTRYDGTIPNQLFRHIKKLRFRFLAKRFRTQSNWELYTWYVDNLLNRFVLLPSGEVTQQTCGNPSGQVSTTMDNNMVNVWLQAFEFCHLNGLSYDEARELWPRYDTLIYGDDRLNTTPRLPSDYVTRVIDMYRDVFGMWVKPEKVRVQDTIVGLSFCGFRVMQDYTPAPVDPLKLLATFNTPVKKLQDIETLYCKILCFSLLCHNLPEDDIVKNWCAEAKCILAQHLRANGRDPPVIITRDMLDTLWSGGPKRE